MGFLKFFSKWKEIIVKVLEASGVESDLILAVVEEPSTRSSLEFGMTPLASGEWV